MQLAPDNVRTLSALGDSLLALNRPTAAQAAYRQALRIAQTINPELQGALVPKLQAEAAGKAAPN